MSEKVRTPYPKVKIENYVPEIVESNSNLYAKLVVPLTRCPTCDCLMLYRYSYQWSGFESIFPKWVQINLYEQLSKAGILIYSHFKDKDDKFICRECAKEGKNTFVCALCDEERTSDLKEESYGDSPEYLCSVCYESVSAKEWDKKNEELREAHKYDFE